MNKTSFEKHKTKRINQLRIREAYHPLSNIRPHHVTNITNMPTYKQKIKQRFSH